MFAFEVTKAHVYCSDYAMRCVLDETVLGNECDLIQSTQKTRRCCHGAAVLNGLVLTVLLCWRNVLNGEVVKTLQWQSEGKWEEYWRSLMYWVICDAIDQQSRSCSSWVSVLRRTCWVYYSYDKNKGRIFSAKLLFVTENVFGEGINKIVDRKRQREHKEV